MRAHHLSMSRMSLAYLCAYGFRPDVAQYPRPPGRPARVGSNVHTLIEQHVKGKPLSLIGDESEQAEALEMFSPPLMAWLDRTTWTACEIGIRYDAAADKSEMGARRGEAGYSEVTPSVLIGTLDLVHVDGDLVTVVDAKSGKLVKDTEQLRAQAVAASRLYGAKRARVGYVYARKTKCDEPKWLDLSEDDLDVEAGRIGTLLRKLPMAEPNPCDHCWKCDARPGCPAYGAEAAESRMADLEGAGMFG